MSKSPKAEIAYLLKKSPLAALRPESYENLPSLLVLTLAVWGSTHTLSVLSVTLLPERIVCWSAEDTEELIMHNFLVKKHCFQVVTTTFTPV